MDQNFWQSLSVIALSIVGVASLAVLVSKNANTTSVISATGSAFSNALGVALSPVTGGSSSISSAFPIS